MSHFCTDGVTPCAYRDGHAWSHRTAEGVERKLERQRTPEYRERQREWKRERYANDPEYRERQRACVNARNRERWATDPEFRIRKAISMFGRVR